MKIGDICTVVHFEGEVVPLGAQYLFGTEVEIIGPGSNLRTDWIIDGPHVLANTECSKRHLKPLPPPNEVTTWDECVFKPAEFAENKATNLCTEDAWFTK